MMNRVAIIAPTGMLGSMVYKELKDGYELVLVYRDEHKLKLLHDAYGGVDKHVKVHADFSDLYQDYLAGFMTDDVGPSAKVLFDKIGNVDAVINCAGVIKPFSLKDPGLTMFINGAVPHILSQHYEKKLIQITTDCVFSGVFGSPYDENSPKKPNDLYGLSKSLGEPKEKSLVLRTSIVGPELGEGSSLIAWFKKQKGNTIKGFTTHLWNGITTKEFAKVCKKIIDNRQSYEQTGLYHIFGSDVSKFEMLELFKKKFDVAVNIEPASPKAIDRRLRTIHNVCGKLHIPAFAEMIEEL